MKRIVLIGGSVTRLHPLTLALFNQVLAIYDAINTSKIRCELGRLPEEIFEKGLPKTLQWYLGNTEWWEELLSGAYLLERIGVER